MNTLMVGGLVVGLVVAAGGYLFYENVHAPECSGDAVAGISGAQGHRLLLVLHNNVTADPLRVCLHAADGTKLYDQVHQVQGDHGSLFEVQVPQQPKYFTAHRAGRGGMQLDNLDWYLAAKECRNVAPEYLFSTYHQLIHVDCDVGSNRPFEVRRADASTMGVAAIPPTEGGLGGAGSAASLVIGGTLAIALPIVVFRQPLRWAFAGLFTRILAPKVLQQSVRSQIHQLVQQEPGIRATEIAQRLELAAGQTAHHLRVLLRAQTLATLRTGLATHYFVRGAYSPQRMRQLAFLRKDSVARLHQALRQRPGSPLTALAREGGVSKARASRLARQLQELGLARGERQGKNLRLYPIE